MKRLAALLLITLFLCGVLFACAPESGGALDESGSYAQSSGVAAVAEMQEGKPTDGVSQAEPPKYSEALQTDEAIQAEGLSELGSYTSKDDVFAYLVAYGRLPENFITKRAAEELGWDARDGNLDEVAPGMSIGGDKFGNREGKLPNKKGRKYYECDINYVGGFRNGERLIFSNDGLYFYTDDHYETFSKLDGE